jgi:hypothetical protein
MAPKAQAPTIVVSAPKSRSNAQWSEQDETILLQYLIDHKAEGGDGGNFKQPVWQGLVGELAKIPHKGADKNVTSCQNKWKKV